MNYIAIVNNFWNEAPFLDGYKSDHAALFFAIVDSINRNEWQETEIEYDRMINKVKMGKRMYLDCRKWLVEHGFILLKQGRNEYTKAKFFIGPAVLVAVPAAVQNSTAGSTSTQKAAVQIAVQKRTKPAPQVAPYLNKTVKPLNNKQERKKKESFDPSFLPSDEVNFSKDPVKGFEKKAPPVAAAPPVLASLRVQDWEHASSIICRSEEAHRLGMKEVRATGLSGMYSEFAELVTDFIEDNRLVYGDTLPWKSEKDLRSHFRNWLPKFLPIKADKIRNAAAHQNTGKPASGPVAGRKYTPTYKSGSSRDLPVDERNPDSRIIRIDGD